MRSSPESNSRAEISGRPPLPALDFLAGGGEMGERMRALDWTHTSLGSPASWPQSLKTIVRVLLDSRYAMWMLWGIGLPEMDGYEVARRMRAIPELRNVRLVAVTGYGQPDDRRRARESGFDDHLTKPVDLSNVERTIAGLSTTKND